MQAELDEIRRLVELPLILDLETAEKVFSHKSLFGKPAHVHVESEEPQDYERFAFLGDQVLSFVATDVIFERYAHARPSFLTEKRALVIKNEELAKWSSAYELPQRLKAHPSQHALVQSSIPVRASIFEAYIGAVFTESGLPLVEHWLKPLIRRVLDLDDNRTPKFVLSPLSKREDSDAGTDDMSEHILLRRHLDAMSIAETTSTRVGTGSGPYRPSMNRFSPRSIAPSSHDGSLNIIATPSTTFMDAAHAQPMPVATGKPSPLKHEIRDYQPGRYSPNFPGFHSPTLAPNSHYTSDTTSNIPSHSPQQSPPSFRSSSSSTVRPPAGSPQDSSSANANVPSPRPSPRPSPSAASSSSSDSHSAQSPGPTRSVAGGYLALFNQMATQKKEKVEWKISSAGPPHRPTFDAQVLIDGYCHGRGHALTKKQAQQSAAETALRSLGTSVRPLWSDTHTHTRTQFFWTRADVRAWRHKRNRIFVPERQIQSLFRILFSRRK